MKSPLVCAVLLWVCLNGGLLAADEKTPPADEQQQARHEKFREMLDGVKLVGQFTVTGAKDTEPRTETYIIEKAEKTERGDYWVFHYKYGNGVLIPLPLEVKWADDTPMITLTDLTILGNGPYSARVLFHDGMYAGTWSHGKVGGHFFGKIEKMTPEENAPKEDKPKE